MKNLILAFIVLFGLNSCDNNEEIPTKIDEVKIDDRPIELISYEGIVGNSVLKIPNKIRLEFNKPINISLIKNLNTYCISEIVDTVYEDSNKVVTFNFGCSSLGSTCPIEIRVYDSIHNSLQKTLDVPFYGKKISLEGKCTNVFFDEVTGFYWVATKNPNKISVLSSNDLSMILEFPITFIPGKMQLNPYNNNLYVISGEPERLDSTIYVIDRNNGNIIKSIIFHRDQYDHPNQPRIHPYDFAISSSGNGIVLLMDYAGSGHRWKIIDCKNNDSISIHPKWGWDLDQFPYFGNAYLNHDKSKIILTERFGSCQIEILDGNSFQFRSIIPPSRTRSGYLVPHRYEDKIYVAQLYDQFIMDLNGNIGNISYLDNRGDRCADFTYIEGQESFIYYLLDGYFILLDYATSTTPMYCGSLGSFKNLTTTLDGKGVIAQRNNHKNPLTEIYYFETKDFYRYVGTEKSAFNENLFKPLNKGRQVND